MKDLYLVRHAKSCWKQLHLDDFDRELNQRGKRAAPLMGAWMNDQNIKPELVYCSPAERASQTYLLMRGNGLDSPKANDISELYHASYTTLLSLVQQIPDKINCVMVIGHNPGLQVLLSHLIKCAKPQKASNFTSTSFINKFPTGGFAHIKFDVAHWSDIAPLAGSLYRIMSPKYLPL